MLRAQDKKGGEQVLAAIAILLISLAIPAQATAIAPPNVSVSISFGPSWFLLGDVGLYSKRGFSGTLKSKVTWRYVGFVLGISRSDYLTTQDAPPYNYLFGFYDFQVGATGFVNFYNFGIHLDPSYRRYGILSNSLIRYTGAETGFHAVGADLEVSYQVGIFFVAIRSSAFYVFKINTLNFGLELGAGIRFGR